MKIIVEFESMDEFEAFRTSGKKTRGKNTKDDEPTVEEVAEKQAQMVAQPAAPAFTPPAVATQPQGFPGANSGAPSASAAAHPLVAAILARIDGALSSGQKDDAIVAWFRQQIGPEAANASLDQIKQIYVPRMSELQLKQIAPQLGITG